MSRRVSLLRSLRRDRTYVYRLLALLLFISMSSITVVILHFHEHGQLRKLEIMNLVSGIIISAVFIYGAIDLAKRNINYESVKKEREKISTKLSSSQALLFRIDNETRQEVGSWLHGTLQPQLTRLAKDIREKKQTDCTIVAQQVDEINEKFVRAYSHDLYPPSLIVSLEVGLETLLENRAELILDHRLTNASNIGFSFWSSGSGFEDSDRPLRFVLGRERSYAVYRIVEEAVANAEKKSSTSRIVVDVGIKDEKIRVSIHDNGAPIPADAKPGLGHSVIDAFVQKFDGNVSFKNVGDGVELIAYIPYHPKSVAETLNRRFQKQG
jgi:signal transduction histidine kinase